MSSCRRDPRIDKHTGGCGLIGIDRVCSGDPYAFAPDAGLIYCSDDPGGDQGDTSEPQRTVDRRLAFHLLLSCGQSLCADARDASQSAFWAPVTGERRPSTFWRRAPVES